MKTLSILTAAIVLISASVLAFSDGPSGRVPAARKGADERGAAPGRLLLAQQEPAKPKPEGQQPAGPEPKEPAAEPAPIESPEAVETLTQARKRLVGYRSVQAGIVEKVAIGNRKFTATGRYLQGTDLRLRLEFEIQVGTSRGSLLEVCDGEVLWTRRRVAFKPVGAAQSDAVDADSPVEKPAEKEGKPPTKPRETDNVQITRRNVREILKAASHAETLPENLLIAELGLGGLPGLLAALDRTMVFETQVEESVGDREFIVVEGTWEERFLSRWQGTNSEEKLSLPEYIPDRVRVYFSKDDLFPLRILYLKKNEGREVYRAMVTVDFRDVVVNGAVNAAEFNYEPPDTEIVADVTNQYLNQLERAASQPSPLGATPAVEGPNSQPQEPQASPPAQKQK